MKWERMRGEMTGVKAALKAALGKHGHGFRSGKKTYVFFLGSCVYAWKRPWAL